MRTYALLRHFGFLACALLSLTCAAQAQFPLVVEPKVLEVASTVTLTVISNGALNLSGITARKVRFRPLLPGEFVEDIFTDKVEATARRLTVTVAVPDRRLIGEREMDIDFGGGMSVTLKFTLVPPFFGCPKSCRAPFMCSGTSCVLPKSQCNPRCKPPTPICNEFKRCERAQ
jgi:hypothetical protein